MNTRIHQDASLRAAHRRAPGKRRLLTRTLIAAAIVLPLSLAIYFSHPTFAANPMAYPVQIAPPAVSPVERPATLPNTPDIFAPNSDPNATPPAANDPTPDAVSQASSLPPPKQDSLAFPTETKLDCPGKFITCLAQDLSGNLWAGTEDQGCYRGTRAPDGHFQWTQYSGSDLGGDNSVYAIAVDKLNRVWCGLLNHGVACFNGEKWQTYGPIADPTANILPGPLGSRVFAIATSPLDGDIWIATEAGLARYSLAKDTWSYITRAGSYGSSVAETRPSSPSGSSAAEARGLSSSSGSSAAEARGSSAFDPRNCLPSDQIASIAFNKAGKIFCATQCDGLATATDNYKTWKTLRGPDAIPVAPTGAGLPTNLLNSVLVASDGTVYLATTTGIAISHDNGDSFSFIRGVDYIPKARGLYIPRGLVPASAAVYSQLLTEDYVTNISEDPSGHIWIAHRATGYEIINPKSTLKFSSKSDPKITEKDPYVTTILQISNSQLPNSPHQIFIARYGAGLSEFHSNAPVQKADQTVKLKVSDGGLFLVPDVGTPTEPPALSKVERAELPKPAAPPGANDLKELAQNLKSLPAVRSPVAFLGEDWCTQGDWCNHKGAQLAILCSANWPFDDNFAGYNDVFWAKGSIDPRYEPKDALRHWLHWMEPDNIKCLYDPMLGHRRQAEWDDHGEVYKRTQEGPDVWITVHTPKGVHQISLYLVNKDGHTEDRTNRDFLITVRAADGAQTDGNPILASARVCSFWGGVYKEFAVQGGMDYVFKIQRNYSFDAILSGIFIDRLAGKPTEFEDLPDLSLAYVRYRPPDAPDGFPGDKNSTSAAAQSLWNSAAAATASGEIRPACAPYRALACRAAMAAKAPQAVLDNWRWQMALPTDADRSTFDAKMAEAWEKVLTHNPRLKELVAAKDEKLKDFREKNNLGD